MTYLVDHKSAFLVIFLIFDHKSIIFGCFNPFSKSDGVITELVLFIDARTWIYNKFGLSLKFLGREVTMETTIYSPILTNLTWENRSKMNVNYTAEVTTTPFQDSSTITFYDKTTIKKR